MGPPHRCTGADVLVETFGVAVGVHFRIRVWEALRNSGGVVTGRVISQCQTGEARATVVIVCLIAVANPGNGAKVAIFAFVLLMIGREGLEAATMIASLAQSNDSTNLAIGGVLGLVIAGLVAWAWSKYGHRINLGLFFQVTAVFMVIFSIQLLIYAFHEYTESVEVANLGLIDNAYWHAATEAYGPEGRIGAWISYSLVLVPLGFLVYSFITRKSAPTLANSN